MLKQEKCKKENIIKNIKNQNGSITLFVLIALLFFLILAFSAYVASTSKLQAQEKQYSKIKSNYENSYTDDDIKNEYLENTVIKRATAAMPEGASIDPTTNENTGIVMIDSNQNEWVWIEVPSSVFTNAKNSTDYDNIKMDLIAYAKDYRSDDCTDTWYSGCGLTQEEYTTKYQTMLSSIYTNKGFYVGRYEAGIEGSDINTSLARYERTEITNSSPKAVIRKDMIPYNFVTCSDAQQLATGMSTGNKTSSLLFGIQWDLVCKFLEVKGNWDTTTNTAQYYIKENSTSWGNYSNSSITLVRGKYNISPNLSSSTWVSFNKNTENYVTNFITATNKSMLLTTGASENTNKMNIYDLAGNEYEWTLEKNSNTDNSCSSRGGSHYSTGFDYPVSHRYDSPITNRGNSIGLRVSLY